MQCEVWWGFLFTLLYTANAVFEDEASGFPHELSFSCLGFFTIYRAEILAHLASRSINEPASFLDRCRGSWTPRVQWPLPSHPLWYKTSISTRIFLSLRSVVGSLPGNDDDRDDNRLSPAVSDLHVPSLASSGSCRWAAELVPPYRFLDKITFPIKSHYTALTPNFLSNGNIMSFYVLVMNIWLI